MFIKTLAIQGFKSYKDQVILEVFSEKQNVVVGKNGSGKSNFFWAIRFVLSDAYQNMTREERQSLLHDGQGTVLSAFVEILFDNKDNRFPTGRDEVTLRRTIGLKKDEYSLDRKTVSKSEVLNLLESAGFSRSNPYYIVPQGRITALTNAKDSERLQLLKEVAGTKVYEQKRLESQKIMVETHTKRDQIDELLVYITERLEELEEEKKELQEYQTADRERRCLEYSLYFRDQSEAVGQLDVLEEDRITSQEETVEFYRSMSDRQVVIEELERELQSKKVEIERMDVEKEQLDEDLDEAIKAKTVIQLEVQEAESGMTELTLKNQRLSAERESVQQQIESQEGHLRELQPLYERSVAAEKESEERVKGMEVEVEVLTSKVGRYSHFTSGIERDQFIKKRLEEQRVALGELEGQLEEQKGVSSLVSEQIEVVKGVMDKAAASKAKQVELVRLAEIQFDKVKGEKEALEGERKRIWREESRVMSTFESVKGTYEKISRELLLSMDKGTSRGLRSVQKIVEKHGIQGYFGPLYDLFSVDENLNTAVDVVAGGSLFYVVVDSEATAHQIVTLLNREKGGRVTFLPLDGLVVKQVQYPLSEQAIPLVSRLEYLEGYEKAMQQVFGRSVIAPSLEEASVFARQYGLTGVTFDGDRADRRGGLSGGYVLHSRMDCVVRMRVARDRVRGDEVLLRGFEKALADVERSLMSKKDELDKHLSSLLPSSDSSVVGVPSVESDLSVTSKLNELNERRVECKEQIVSLMKQAVEVRGVMDRLDSEMLEDFKPDLKSKERLKLVVLELESELLSFRTLKRLRVERESAKNDIELSLSLSLFPLLSTLSPISSTPLLSTQSNLLLLTESKSMTNESTLIREKRLKLMELKDELKDNLIELKGRIDKLLQDQKSQESKIKAKQLLMDKFLTKKAVLTQKKESSLIKIRQLGILPDEAFNKFESLNQQTLLKMLYSTNLVLKNFSHVNKKAFEQYSNFTKQGAQLNQRKVELLNSANSIESLIKTLDSRKNEAIDLTFNQVAKHFKSIWSSLVPTGDANLLLLTNPTTRPSADSYTGISLSVSFQPQTPLKIHQLSGGQKSLVALTLIFAIQKCDPAPFYLFDEIDAALDTQYRTSIAEMVKKLSQNAQFIMTTFRKELVGGADKCYGVDFVDRVSRVKVITKDEAMAFVESQG